MHPSPFSQFCAINKSQEMGEAGELISLVSSGLHLGRLQVERTAGPRELRVVRGRAGPLPGHREWLQREHGKSSRQAGVGPLPGQCCLPPRKASEEQTEAQGWLVGHSVGFVLMRPPAFQSLPVCLWKNPSTCLGKLACGKAGFASSVVLGAALRLCGPRGVCLVRSFTVSLGLRTQLVC